MELLKREFKMLKEGFRSLFLGLEERIGRKLDARERIVAFILDYAAYLINRISQGTGGKVAYERMKGKKPTVLGI